MIGRSGGTRARPQPLDGREGRPWRFQRGDDLGVGHTRRPRPLSQHDRSDPATPGLGDEVEGSFAKRADESVCQIRSGRHRTTSWHLGSPRAIGKRRPLRGRPDPPTADAGSATAFPIIRQGDQRPSPATPRLAPGSPACHRPRASGCRRFLGYGLCKPWKEVRIVSDLSSEQFADFFKALHGHDPYPWQTRLAEYAVAGDWPVRSTCPQAAVKQLASMSPSSPWPARPAGISTNARHPDGSSSA